MLDQKRLTAEKVRQMFASMDERSMVHHHVNLLEYLISKKQYFTGTFQANRVGFPEEIRSKQLQLNFMEHKFWLSEDLRKILRGLERQKGKQACLRYIHKRFFSSRAFHHFGSTHPLTLRVQVESHHIFLVSKIRELESKFEACQASKTCSKVCIRGEGRV
ncbi:hypothetical protein RRG08_059844 [Elysia crispata]|uniref:Uncharacterized protein n=1 Tax=Elysia crispata TaxID=231223 RepID=A0AAE1CJW7_9GAST|nr:hypothetical protein RRG08_059844 [Elysia crispata]